LKYGIRIKGKLDNNGFFVESELRSVLSEHIGIGNAKTLTFNTFAEAEQYAKTNNLTDYNVETIRE
jgi:hypothetical protein